MTSDPQHARVLRCDADDAEREDAIWKSSYVSNLPDSAFLYVEAGGTKDADGRTSPRSLRHFPYRDDTGKVDMVHVRDAIGRIPQSSIDPKLKSKLQEKARNLLHEGGTSRTDSIRLDAKKMTKTPQGGLKGPAAVSRVGVFRYRHADGTTVHEYRPAEEVFRADSLATLEDAPITDMHPAKMVDTTDFTKLSKGHVRDAKQDGMHVEATALIQDAGLAAAVLAGKRLELSCGYSCEFDPTPGLWNGQRYDGVQRNITYNHVALLPPGGSRQGATVALRFDACQDDSVMIFHFDGKDYDLATEEGRKGLAAAQAAVEATKTGGEKARADKAEGERDAALAELAPLKAERAKAVRTALEAQVRKLRGDADKDVKYDGLTDRDLRERCIGADKCKGRTDEYVGARFDSLVEAPVAETTVVDPVAAAAAASLGTPGGAGTVPVASVNPLTNAYKQPLAFSKDRK